MIAGLTQPTAFESFRPRAAVQETTLHCISKDDGASCWRLCYAALQCKGLSDHGIFSATQISMVVYLFKYPVRTALAVGLSMAQIGEFAFVLLSVASQLGLLPYQVYMLLMGAQCSFRLTSPVSPLPACISAQHCIPSVYEVEEVCRQRRASTSAGCEQGLSL